MDKLSLLKLTLRLGAVYYIIGAIVHYFDLTLFPWYDARLSAPYHDSVIALCSLIFTFLLLIIARDPIKNIDTLRGVIIAALVASVFSVWVIWHVDFTALGAPDKQL